MNSQIKSESKDSLAKQNLHEAQLDHSYRLFQQTDYHQDVIYVPESPDQILSLMKLRREQAGFFTATETFEISFPNGVLFSGKSTNDILYIWRSPMLHINAVVTHNAAKGANSQQHIAPWTTTSDAQPCSPNNLKYLSR